MRAGRTIAGDEKLLVCGEVGLGLRCAAGLPEAPKNGWHLTARDYEANGKRVNHTQGM